MVIYEQADGSSTAVVKWYQLAFLTFWLIFFSRFWCTYVLIQFFIATCRHIFISRVFFICPPSLMECILLFMNGHPSHLVVILVGHSTSFLEILNIRDIPDLLSKLHVAQLLCRNPKKMKAPAVTDDKVRRYKKRKIYFATGN